MKGNSTATVVDIPEIRVAFVLQPAFTLLSFSSFVDVLRVAADESDRSRQVLCR